MKHLVTGVAGFVGSNLARKLLDAGHHVTGLDNMSCGFMENIKDLVTHPSGFNFQVAEIGKELGKAMMQFGISLPAANYIFVETTLMKLLI